MQGVARSAGMCIMSLVFWGLHEWRTFMWVTSLPIAIFLCFPTYMIESPRWLATNGKWEKSASFLKRIANVNGTQHLNITGDYLKRTLPQQSNERVYGMASFFTGWRLAINTMLLVMCWWGSAIFTFYTIYRLNKMFSLLRITSSLGYFILILYIAQLPGNPFLNFFWQSFVEIPSFFASRYLCKCLFMIVM